MRAKYDAASGLIFDSCSSLGSFNSNRIAFSSSPLGSRIGQSLGGTVHRSPRYQVSQLSIPLSMVLLSVEAMAVVAVAFVGEEFVMVFVVEEFVVVFRSGNVLLQNLLAIVFLPKISAKAV